MKYTPPMAMGSFYRVLILQHAETYKYDSWPIWACPPICDMNVIYRFSRNTEWEVQDLNNRYHLLLADGKAVKVLSKGLLTPVVTWNRPEQELFEQHELLVGEVSHTDVTKEQVQQAVYQSVKPFRPFTQPVMAANQQLVQEVLKSHILKRVIPREPRPKKETRPPANPTARLDPSDPKGKLWIIDCEDCSKPRQVHKADLFQVRRCQSCQSTYTKRKNSEHQKKDSPS